MKTIMVFVKNLEQIMQGTVLHHSCCNDHSEPEWCVVNINNIIHVAWKRNDNWVAYGYGLSTIYDQDEDEATGELYSLDLNRHLSKRGVTDAPETCAAFDDGNCGKRLEYGRWCATCKYDGNCPIQVGM